MEKFLVSREFGPCPECKSELLHHCVKNGVKFVQGGRKHPIAVWNCDLYKCPGCESFVITDFAERPKIAFSGDPAWFRKQYIQSLENEEDMIVYGK